MVLYEFEYFVNDAIFDLAVAELNFIWQLIKCKFPFQSLKIADLLSLVLFLLVGISVRSVLLLLACSLPHFADLFDFIREVLLDSESIFGEGQVLFVASD